MKNLFDFIVKYLYAIVFILIEIVCFALIFTNNNYHKVSFLNSSNALSASVEEQWNGITEYTRLKSINDSIVSENQKLRNLLEEYRREDIPSIEDSGFEYISAKVLSVTVNRVQNSLTISKGLNDGVEQEMGVVGPNGIVGIVFGTSANYASVMPLIHPEFKISVKLEKNDFFGSLYWDEVDNGLANLSEIPGYVDVQVGDVVITSGFSAIFPEGIPVGTVKEFSKNESTKFYHITIDLFTDFNNLSYVYVIENVNKEEQLQFNNTEADDQE